MFYGAKNHALSFNGNIYDYITFGKGDKPLIMIPGLGDGLKTVKGLALPFARLYKRYAKQYKVYVFSRPRTLKEGMTVLDMAHDLADLFKHLGIVNAHVIGLSQGGMIAQHLAIHHPSLIDRLVLSVTLAEQTPTVQHVIGHWIRLAQANDYRSLFIDTLEKTYTEKKLKRYRPWYFVLTRVGKPKSMQRLLIQAQACLTHDTLNQLTDIPHPTLVVGGDQDLVVGEGTSETLAKHIPNATLVLYHGLGHGAYDEAKDYDAQVLRFLAASER